MDSRESKTNDKLVNNKQNWKNIMKTSFRLDPFMIPTKFTYFLWGGLIGTWQLFINAFFLSVGLSGSQAGLITGLTFLSSSLAGPLWGMLIDYTGRRRAILAVISVVSSVFIGTLPWVATAFIDESFPVSCEETGSSLNITTNSTLPSDDCLRHHTDDLFQVLLIIMIFGSSCINILPNYMEAICMDVVSAAKSNPSYGEQRIFGSIGTCVWVYLSGVLIDSFKFYGMSPYTVAFFVYAPFALMMIPTGFFLINQSAVKVKNTTFIIENEDEGLLQVDVGMLQHLRHMFSQFDVLFLMLTVLIAGIAFNLNIYFGVLLIEERLVGISQTEISIIFVTASASSIFLFPFTSKIIEILRGPFIPITLGILTYFIRYIVMSYTSAYWLMLTLQVFHCIGFALLWSAMMQHVNLITPKKIQVTMILILQTIHFSISPILVNVAGGSIIKIYSSTILYRWTGALCGVWSILNVIFCFKVYRNGGFKKDKATVTVNASLPISDMYDNNSNIMMVN